MDNVTKSLLLGAVVLDKQGDKTLKFGKERDDIKTFIENYDHADPALLTEISKIISQK